MILVIPNVVMSIVHAPARNVMGLSLSASSIVRSSDASRQNGTGKPFGCVEANGLESDVKLRPFGRDRERDKGQRPSHGSGANLRNQ
jgi:hypothetical protein